MSKTMSAMNFARTHACDADWIAAAGDAAIPVYVPGQTGTCNGQPATIIQHYRNAMYEVRLPGGTVCVTATDFTADQMATKLVEVRLSALTRVEYMEVVEVPANITQAELDDLVNERYRQVDGGEFTSDPDYWERGTCEAVDSDMPEATPTMMAFRTEHGLHIERADAAGQQAGNLAS